MFTDLDVGISVETTKSDAMYLAVKNPAKRRAATATELESEVVSRGMGC